MKREDRPYLVLAMIPILMAMPVITAHVPQFDGGGSGLDDARVVDDPTKSWVIYTSLDGPEQVDYYKLSLKEGDLMLLEIIVPATEGDRGFSPDMVVMGPGIEDNGTVPRQIERADGGAMVLESDDPSHLVYEPFSPSAFHELAGMEIEAPADGDYYVAVFNGTGGGDYGLVVGKRESFSLGEWLTVPFSLLTVYRWEGQQWWNILLPGVLAFLIGMSASALGLRIARERPDARWMALAIAGSLMIASGAVFGYQMASKLVQVGGIEPAAALSAVFTLLPLLLGIVTLRMAQRPSQYRVTSRFRISLLIIAILGLVAWSGWIIGPALVAVAALLPSRTA